MHIHTDILVALHWLLPLWVQRWNVERFVVFFLSTTTHIGGVLSYSVCSKTKVPINNKERFAGMCKESLRKTLNRPPRLRFAQSHPSLLRRGMAPKHARYPECHLKPLREACVRVSDNLGRCPRL